MKQNKVILAILLVTVLALSAVLASCGVVEFSVSFVVKGEKVATLVSTNSQLKLPENPTKTGYTFDGWYWDDGTWQKPLTLSSLTHAPIAGEMFVYAKFNLAHEHTAENWTTVSEPTCGAEGCKQAVCTICNEQITQTIEPTGLHQMVNKVCAVCGYTEVPSNEDVTGITVSTSKVYVTSLGQFAISTAESLLDAAGVTYTSNLMLEAKDCPEGSTVVIMLGSSTKGLGAAGTDAAGEIARAQAFAKRTDLNIVCIDTGKKASGRGTIADPIIREICPKAKVILVVDGGDDKGGNYDGLFTGFYANNNVPVYLFTSASKMSQSVKNIFGKAN